MNWHGATYDVKNTQGTLLDVADVRKSLASSMAVSSPESYHLSLKLFTSSQAPLLPVSRSIKQVTHLY